MAVATATIAACSPGGDLPPAATTLPHSAPPSATPFRPSLATATPETIRLWISPAVPERVRRAVEIAVDAAGSAMSIVPEAAPDDVRLEVGGERAIATWTFVVVAPFPTVADSISMTDLRAAWGRIDGAGLPVFVTEPAAAALAPVLGPPGSAVRVMADPETTLTASWSARPSLAIVPFEDLEVRWKVLAVDGRSPLRSDFDPSSDPLTVAYGLAGEGEAALAVRDALGADGAGWATNRRSDRITSVVVTGVTALVRATAWQMNRRGIGFPASDIGDWLRSADVTHISHEVSFTPTCPPAQPEMADLIFCASPPHAELLAEVGADVIELTGNHILDVGPQAFLFTLDLYRQRGWSWYGGGVDLAEARVPARIEHNGNRIAFLGCNQAGPPNAWATESRPGTNPCGADYLSADAAGLKRDGYLPIATFQWEEYFTPVPVRRQREAFRAAAEAGAVAVSGSQAHQPQGFEFHKGAFIHYGLGNLFFDQMWSEAVRKEFVDRYIFHDGRLVSVELLTAYLEDWARPRPMTGEERAAFLEEIFAASGW